MSTRILFRTRPAMRRRAASLLPSTLRGFASTSPHRLNFTSWSYPPSVSDVANDEVSRLASGPRRPLTLTDLLRHGQPPLSEQALLASANFTLLVSRHPNQP
ncbi:hypothetical protein KEM55_003193 [Ascosphaera atra]|nr:hypothetical protein KEM55_003193 [Ascosphaera atra]